MGFDFLGYYLPGNKTEIIEAKGSENPLELIIEWLGKFASYKIERMNLSCYVRADEKGKRLIQLQSLFGDFKYTGGVSAFENGKLIEKEVCYEHCFGKDETIQSAVDIVKKNKGILLELPTYSINVLIHYMQKDKSGNILPGQDMDFKLGVHSYFDLFIQDKVRIIPTLCLPFPSINQKSVSVIEFLEKTLPFTIKRNNFRIMKLNKNGNHRPVKIESWDY